MLKNNKAIFIILFVFIFLLVYSTFSFASFSVDYNGSSLQFADFPFDKNSTTIHYFLVYGTYGYTVCFYEGKDFGKFVYSGGVVSSYYENGNKIVNGSLKISDYNTSTKTWGPVKEWGDLTGGVNGFILSNENIYDGSGNIFFRLAPVGQLGEIVEKVETQGVIMEIVKILPLILVVVVSFLGLRKAWKLLSTLLHQA